MSRIYLSVPHMCGEEQRFVRDAFDSNWLSSVGPNLDGFEQDVREYLGADRQALAVVSGTAALHLILRYVGVSAGDRVAVSTLTFAGSVWPILYLGAQPVFLDCDGMSANLNADLVVEYLATASRRGELPKALVAVHLYGQHADIDPIAAACAEYGVILIEDSAESLGASYRGRQTATTADFAILSFNGNKIITTTGGGMVIARSAEAIATMKKWANQSREPAIEYVHRELGYNYRLSNVLAGIGRGQMTVLDTRVAQRRAVAHRYEQALADLPGVALLPEMPWGTHTRWLSVIRWDASQFTLTPGTLVNAFGTLDVEVRPVWRPMHTQPMFASAAFHAGGDSEALFEHGLCLPSSSSLDGASQDRVVEQLRTMFESHRR